ncbi:hypothetical protein H257_12359 [Aphanomyces astaci]|uniref:Uncharacterized protein n=1 Tax=Aphanomyces astaci TaxID=112090 RepID=W4G014_APHAT|nr:hypothetical protein H257_12359 [Aphanomyces astaci]ETV72601.1 hypothetical protein H257_12359 [Aphanomyces astaci]|eukprot:XP_009837829.1 hypothetical protein H257_12359 [Aphanomyces astaci]
MGVFDLQARICNDHSNGFDAIALGQTHGSEPATKQTAARRHKIDDLLSGARHQFHFDMPPNSTITDDEYDEITSYVKNDHEH